jgi:hypothetical protein
MAQVETRIRLAIGMAPNLLCAGCGRSGGYAGAAGQGLNWRGAWSSGADLLAPSSCVLPGTIGSHWSARRDRRGFERARSGPDRRARAEPPHHWSGGPLVPGYLAHGQGLCRDRCGILQRLQLYQSEFRQLGSDAIERRPLGVAGATGINRRHWCRGGKRIGWFRLGIQQRLCQSEYSGGV